MSAGADHLKICSSGGVLSPLDKLDSVQFTVPEIKAICDTARNMVRPLRKQALLSKSSRDNTEFDV